MLRIVASKSSAAAIAYYTEGLAREDYYSKDIEVPAVWRGKGAKRLGLDGKLKDGEFAAVAKNLHPLTGDALTPRNKAERLAGWDMNFHVPKSYSILQAITGDGDLMRIFQESVRETMDSIEQMAATRVRVNGRQEDRQVSNLVWAEFIHTTARPVDGAHDCHLHAHCWVANACFDGEEDRWKAVKINEIKRMAPLFEAAFHARLMGKTRELGYAIKPVGKSWEIDGLSRELLLKFSRRTVQIESEAKRKGITNAKEKEKLGAKTRGKKLKGVTKASMLAEWDSRLTGVEREAISRIHRERRLRPGQPVISVGEAAVFVREKLFERDSVVDRQKFLIEMLRHGAGHFDMNAAEREVERLGFVQKEERGKMLMTTMALISEEVQLVQQVRDGRGKLAPMVQGRLEFGRDFLSDEQKNAVRHVFRSNDQVTAIRGKAGTGKTTSLQEIREIAEKQGFRVFAFAPSTEASLVLQSDGFTSATTIARLLVDERMQRWVRGERNLIVIDEAGLCGIRDLLRLMEIAGASTRILLVGDTGQLAPVSRGDAMRLIERFAGLPIAALTEIRRQKVEAYRDAVTALSEGNLKDGFAQLDGLGAIVEIKDGKERYSRLADEWMERRKATSVAPLALSPTNAECREVTAAIRGKLKDAGKLGAERQYTRFHDLRLTDAEKALPGAYETGLMVLFNQNAKGGINRGSVLPVVEASAEKGVWVDAGQGQRVQLDLAKLAKNISVHQAEEIAFAKGDMIRLTKNGESANGRKIANGSRHTITKIGRDGALTLDNGVMLDASHGFFDQGYCQTSYSSQGKRSKDVLVAQSSGSFRASSTEQFYVSVSRGEHTIRLFTDNRAALQAAVGNSAKRLSALEFSGAGEGIFMGGLSGVEWAKRVENFRKQGEARRSYVDRLKAEGKIDPLRKPENMGYAAYIDRERAQVKTGGKVRGKGHPDAKNIKPRGKGKGVVHERGGVDFKEKAKAAEKAPDAPVKAEAKKVQKPESAKAKRVAKSLEGAKSRFKQVWEKMKPKAKATKAAPEKAKPGSDGESAKFRFGKVMTNFKKLHGAVAQKRQVEAKAVRQHKPKPPAPKPPAPVMRRTR